MTIKRKKKEKKEKEIKRKEFCHFV